MGNKKATNVYRKVQVQTAAKDDLLGLLLDGGVRFTEGALIELKKGDEEDLEKRNDYLIRSQKILLELMGALSPAIGLEVYDALQSLYKFTFQRLFEGNLEADETKVREGAVMFKQIRDMWAETIEKAKSEGKGRPGKPPTGSSLSIKG